MYQVPMIFGMGDMDSSEQNIQKSWLNRAHGLEANKRNKQVY